MISLELNVIGVLGSAIVPSSKFSVPSPNVIVGVGSSKSAII